MRNFLLAVALITLPVSLCLAQKSVPKKPDTSSGSTFEFTVEKDGVKTEVKSTQFQTHDGNAFAADQGRITLFYGTSNPKDSQTFSFNGWVPAGATGVFKVGDPSPGAGFSLMTTAYPNVPMFTAEKGGTIEITNSPTSGGFVVGTFHGTCLNITEQGTIETFNVSGSFKLARH